jgi:hypothetical protein
MADEHKALRHVLLHPTQPDDIQLGGGAPTVAAAMSSALPDRSPCIFRRRNRSIGGA